MVGGGERRTDEVNEATARSSPARPLAQARHCYEPLAQHVLAPCHPRNLARPRRRPPSPRPLVDLAPLVRNQGPPAAQPALAQLGARWSRSSSSRNTRSRHLHPQARVDPDRCAPLSSTDRAPRSPSSPVAAQPLYADAPPPVGVHLDPTTKTPFPTRLTSPDGTPLRLVGTGVRTVSFLAVKVYAVAFYASERELDLARKGQLAGWDAYTPERLIPPFKVSPVDTAAPDRLVGEQLIETLLEKADVAVVISASPPTPRPSVFLHELTLGPLLAVPLRNTSLPHLRDGFSRALVARMKVPRVSDAFTDTMNEVRPLAHTLSPRSSEN